MPYDKVVIQNILKLTYFYFEGILVLDANKTKMFSVVIWVYEAHVCQR